MRNESQLNISRDNLISDLIKNSNDCHTLVAFSPRYYFVSASTNKMHLLEK